MEDILNLISKNTITFSRIKDYSCIGYNIYGKIDKEEYKLLDYIENNSYFSPILETQSLEYDGESKEWNLSSDAILNSTSSVKLYINDKLIPIKSYTISYNLYKIYIDIDLKKDDLIVAKYYVDRIKYIHSANRKYFYKVLPVYKNIQLGQHSLL